MLRFLIGVFIVLHGLVHLLYFGQSQRLFELQPGMLWPDGSWAFSRLLGDKAARLLASIGCVLAAIGFVAGGIGILVSQSWWRPITLVAATSSTVVYVLFWDGRLRKLHDKGAIAIFINISILFAMLVLRWPDIGF